MGVYLYTTRTVSKPYFYLYRCSNCGKINNQRVYIAGSANYNARGGLTQQSQILAEQRAKNADIAANHASDVAADKALAKAAQGDYRMLNISAECKNCKHSEPWQRMRIPPFLIGCLPFLIVFGSILFITGITTKGLSDSSTGLGAIMLLLAIVDFFGIWYYRKKLNEQASHSPVASLPHFILPRDDILLDDGQTDPDYSISAALKAVSYVDGEEIIKDDTSSQPGK